MTPYTFRKLAVRLAIMLLLALIAALYGSQGIAQSAAVQPNTPQVEIGEDDFRISYNGQDWFHGANDPAIAHNRDLDEYFVVWRGDHNGSETTTDELEIWGQRLDTASGEPVGSSILISDAGPANDIAYQVFTPDVVYNSTRAEYVVVWSGHSDLAGLAADEKEIYAQRINASNGTRLFTDDVRISEMGPDNSGLYQALKPKIALSDDDATYLIVWYGDDSVNDEFEIYGQAMPSTFTGATALGNLRISNMGPNFNTSYGAFDPDIATNSLDNQFLIVWSGDHNSGGVVDGEFEIYGEVYNYDMSLASGSDMRLSAAGFDGDTSYWALHPAAEYNPATNEYLVVWTAYDKFGSMFIYNDNEIVGQRLDNTGDQIGTNDFQISSVGPNGDASYQVVNPDVTYQSYLGEYLVVWSGEDNTLPLVNDEFEIFGQRLTSAGAATGSDDFLISDMGDDGSPMYFASQPDVIYNLDLAQAMVVWYGSDNVHDLSASESEIFSQRLTTASAETGDNDKRVSFMGRDVTFDATRPAIAYNSQDDHYLVVWQADTNVASQVNDEYEIWGQLHAGNGDRIGENFRISEMGPSGDAGYDAHDPAVTYNPDQNEYLVVWHANSDLAGLSSSEFEIFGQRLEADGTEVGTENFRISTVGADGDSAVDAESADVIYNPTVQEYLVVFTANPDSSRDIFGQRLASNGTRLAPYDFRISDMGPDGDSAYSADHARVAFNNKKNQYMVVWYGDDNLGALVDGEFEIFGQRLSASGSALGSNDFRISSLGPNGDQQYEASNPDISYHPELNEYLVVWEGLDSEYAWAAIFGQRLSSAGQAVGNDGFRINKSSGPFIQQAESRDPAVIYDPTSGGYTVIWSAQISILSIMHGYEIYGQQLTGVATPIGTQNFRLSDLGPTGSLDFYAGRPALAIRGSQSEILATWDGDDDQAPLSDDDFEIFGQIYELTVYGDYPIFLPIVQRD
jgi:hypothetical protein